MNGYDRNQLIFYQKHRVYLNYRRNIQLFAIYTLVFNKHLNVPMSQFTKTDISHRRGRLIVMTTAQ